MKSLLFFLLISTVNAIDCRSINQTLCVKECDCGWCGNTTGVCMAATGICKEKFTKGHCDDDYTSSIIALSVLGGGLFCCCIAVFAYNCLRRRIQADIVAQVDVPYDQYNWQY
jgi:hypothetical protein